MSASNGRFTPELSMAVVIRDGKVLVQHRFRKSKGMVYEFPGGSVESRETGEQAAKRELQEETGLVNLDVIASHSLTSEFGRDIHFVVLRGVAGSNPEATDPERQQVFYWFEPDTIPRQHFYRADIEFMNLYLEKYI